MTCADTCEGKRSHTTTPRIFKPRAEDLRHGVHRFHPGLQLDKIAQLVDKLQQVGKVDNLQKVFGVFGCVKMIPQLVGGKQHFKKSDTVYAL